MTKRRLLWTLSGLFVVSASGLILSRAHDSLPDDTQLPIAHPECAAFGSGREKMVQSALRSQHYLTTTTNQVVRAVTGGTPTPRIRAFDQANNQPMGLIDSYLFADMQAQGVQPAGLT